MSRKLGISERAVRKRIERGTLSARLLNGQYQITVIEADEEQDELSSVPIGRTNLGTSAVPENTAVMVIREAIAPFIVELRQVHEELGTLRNELAHERERREAAENALYALQAHETHDNGESPPRAEKDAPTVAQAPPATSVHPSFFQRMFTVLRGG